MRDGYRQKGEEKYEVGVEIVERRDEKGEN